MIRSLFLSSIPIFLLFATCRCRVELRPEHSLQSYKFWSARALTEGTTTLSGIIDFGSAAMEWVPPFPSSLSGFGGIHRRLLPPALQGGGGEWSIQAPFQRVEIPPRVKVFLWTDEDQHAVVLISLDVVAVTPDLKGRLMAAAQKEMPDLHITSDSFLLTASHTHSGLSGLTEDPLFEVVAGDHFSNRIYAHLESTFLRTLATARQRSSAMSGVSHSSFSLPQFNSSRLASVPVDTTASLTEFTTQSLSACLVSYALHPTSVGQRERTLSADLGGRIERNLESEKGFATCLFLPGLIGNASARLEKMSASDYASKLAINLLTQHEMRKTSESSMRVSTAQKLVRLSPQTFNFQGCAAGWLSPVTSLPLMEARPNRSTVALMRVGEWKIALLPGEVGGDFQELVPKSWNGLFVSVAQDYQGYLVSEEEYRNESLESCSTLHPPRLREAIARAVGTLAQ